ncbi:MAG: hypothetical protein LBO74_04980 [Candidatus Symbiothrix sp.]|jgi:hypothetical protein|nr:hypothetical protein [Candidatus Symbiothrix sp.]
MKKMIFLALTLIVLGAASVNAQVTIGGNPATDVPGALLNLNSTIKGGLLLSNVGITDLDKIPAGTNLFPGITAGTNDDTNTAFAGAIVYNIDPDTGKGIYIWNGEAWTKSGGLK